MELKISPNPKLKSWDFCCGLAVKRESRSSKELEKERGRVDDPLTMEVDLELAIRAEIRG